MMFPVTTAIQKDNKRDKWDSKFVDALKIELEATFKEDISICFDAQYWLYSI
jgi:hypothetical protein